MLLDAGGLLDQPAGLMRRMRYALSVWQVFDSYWKANSWVDWQRRFPDAWKMKNEIDALRAELCDAEEAQ